MTTGRTTACVVSGYIANQPETFSNLSRTQTKMADFGWPFESNSLIQAEDSMAFARKTASYDLETQDASLVVARKLREIQELADVYRLEASRRLNQKLRGQLGQFLTPLPVAERLAQLFRPQPQDAVQRSSTSRHMARCSTR